MAGRRPSRRGWAAPLVALVGVAAPADADAAGTRLEARLAERGIQIDLDLALFSQHASRVESGDRNLGSFAWETAGTWELARAGRLGTGSLAWHLFGSAGLSYDQDHQGASANTGILSGPNSKVFGEPFALDELAWQQVSPSGRLELVAGIVDLLNHFDSNRVAGDGFRQFFGAALENDPSIPSPPFGGFGGVVRVEATDRLALRAGAADSSSDEANEPWNSVDRDSWLQMLELDLALGRGPIAAGRIRLTAWHNHRDGEDGFGGAINLERDLGRGLTAFVRLGLGERRVTPVEAFASGGVQLARPFGRPRDALGVGAAWSEPGSGPATRDETLLEVYYRIGLGRRLALTPDLQVVLDPAEGHRDVVLVGGVRLALEF